MPFANLPPQGSLYVPNYNNIHWTQPGGPNTQVFPAQAINVPMVTYPVPGQFLAENSGLWTTGCQHWFDACKVYRDYDNMLQSSVAVQCCPLCTFIIALLYPYEIIFNEMQFPILIS